MAGYLDHSRRWQDRRPPRDRHVDYTRPGFVRPDDPTDDTTQEDNQ